MAEHLLRDMLSNGHRPVARFGLGKFSDGLVACVMKPKPFERTLEGAGIGAALGAGCGPVLPRAAL